MPPSASGARTRPPAKPSDLLAIITELSTMSRTILAIVTLVVGFFASTGVVQTLTGPPGPRTLALDSAIVSEASTRAEEDRAILHRLDALTKSIETVNYIVGGLARAQCSNLTDRQVLAYDLPCDSLMKSVGGYRMLPQANPLPAPRLPLSTAARGSL